MKQAVDERQEDMRAEKPRAAATVRILFEKEEVTPMVLTFQTPRRSFCSVGIGVGKVKETSGKTTAAVA